MFGQLELLQAAVVLVGDPVSLTLRLAAQALSQACEPPG